MAESPMELDVLGDGVRGYIVERDGEFYVPFVVADNPGSGEFTTWLDEFTEGRTVKFPGVVSPILAGILERRHFTLESEFSPEHDEHVGVWTRPADRMTPEAMCDLADELADMPGTSTAANHDTQKDG